MKCYICDRSPQNSESGCGASKWVLKKANSFPNQIIPRTNPLIQMNDICYVPEWKGRYRRIYNTNDFALVEGIEPLCECAGWSITANYGSGLTRDFKHYVHPQQLIKILSINPWLNQVRGVI